MSSTNGHSHRPRNRLRLHAPEDDGLSSLWHVPRAAWWALGCAAALVVALACWAGLGE